MTTKLKIDLTQGILEVEGSEIFVQAIYRDFKVQFLGEEAVEAEEKPTRRRRSRKTKAVVKTAVQPEQVKIPAPEPVKLAEMIEPEPKPKTVEPAPVYDYLKDLDLAAGPEHPSLVEFMDLKFPITNEERNLVFSYYLQYVVKHKPITLDHIYTCYRKAKIRAPLNVEHSVQMTAEHHGWIRILKNGNLAVTPVGKRYAENELPKRVKG